MTDKQVRVLAGSILIAGGAVAYSCAKATPSFEDNLVSAIVLLVGVPLMLPDLWASLMERVRALKNDR